MTEEPQGTLYIGTKWYEVDVNKLRKSSMTDAAYLFASLRVNEDYEHFDRVKHLLIIPEEPKSLEDLSQELEEKIDALIKTTKEKFDCSQYFAGKRYNEKFDRIIRDFEYAKEHGHFPIVRIAKTGTVSGSYLVSTGSGDLNWITSSITPSFVIKQGETHDGYYTIGDGYYRFYMKEKPNMIFRWFVHKLMGFKWIDEKDT